MESEIEKKDETNKNIFLQNCIQEMVNMKEQFEAKDEKLIAFLAKHNHWSPFGHASLQFKIEATCETHLKSRSHGPMLQKKNRNIKTDIML